MGSSVDAPTALLQPAMVRAVGYSLLAHCFGYPGEEAGEALREAADASHPFLAGSALEDLPALVEAMPLDELAQAHVDLFSLTASADCPAYETAYVGTDLVLQTQRMATIAGLYRMFGVEVPASCARPDDISAELEFMAFLNCKELYASTHLRPARVSQARKAQRLFLSEHLGCWAGTFADAVINAARSIGFYREAAAALGAWVEADIIRTRARPAIRAAGPSLPPASPHSHGPEFAPGTRFIPVDAIQ